VRPLQGDQPADVLAGDRVGPTAGERGHVWDEIGAPGALGIPGVRGEVLVGLGRRLAHRPPAGAIEGTPPQRGEAALMGQRGHGDAPAGARGADQVRCRHAGVGQEHLVERGMEVHLPQRAGLDAGLVHREHEVADAAVLRHVPIGARQEHPVVGVVGARAPQLLTVDDPLLTVALRPRREPGEVRAVARLAEQLAPRVLARDRPRQQSALELVGAVGEQRRRGEAHPGSQGRADGPGGGQLLGDDGVGPPGQAAAVPFARPRGRAPAAGDEQTAPVEQAGRGVPVLGEPRSHLGADCIRSHRAGSRSPARNDRSTALNAAG